MELSIGLLREEIDTPALLIDLDLMEKNISTMASFFKGKKAKLRAHTKVHRTPMIAHKQIEAGAKGICCQKVGEAEAMSSAGVKDIMVTNQIVAPKKVDRLIALTKQCRISVPIDDANNAKYISKTAVKEETVIDVLVDVHLGSNRCGVESGKPALKLAKFIHGLNGCRLTGLMGFEGQVSWMEPREKRRREVEKFEKQLIDTKELIEKDGMKIDEISTGTTGTYDASGCYPGVTEVQAGTYVLMDSNYHKFVLEFDCALSVLSTIISKPSSNRAITDAGLMSIGTSYGNPLIKNGEGLEVFELHAENTVLTTEKTSDIGIGDKIEFIPSYIDLTVNLNEKFYAMRNEKVEAIWDIKGGRKSN